MIERVLKCSSVYYKILKLSNRNIYFLAECYFKTSSDKGGKNLMLTILIILNITLAVLLTVFSVKNLLINFKTSEKWIKNVLIISLTVIALVFSLIGLAESFQVKESIDSLQYQLSIAKDSVIINGIPEKESIHNMISFEEKRIKWLIIYPILGYLSYSIVLFINKKLIEESNKISTSRRWYVKDNEK